MNELQDRITKTACFNMASRIVAQMKITGKQSETLYALKLRMIAEAIHKELIVFIANGKEE